MSWLLALGLLIPQDTTAPRPLPAIVVTAERSAGTEDGSAAAVTRLSATELARLPHATLAELLRRVPGFHVIDFDGLGFDPQVMVRGFYGGGEAEYVIVQVDGRPVNQVQSGVVAWDVLPPLASIAAIEVVRGGASSLYGDAAIGGIINVITRAERQDRARLAQWEASIGRYGTGRGSAMATASAGTLTAGIDRTAGYRMHSERTAAHGLLAVPLLGSAGGSLRATLVGHRRSFDEPGPLRASLADEVRQGSDPLFRFDHSRDLGGSAGIAGDRSVGPASGLSGSAGLEVRNVHAIRTLALAPGFGDTKERHANSRRGAFALQLTTSAAPLPRTDRLVIGLELSRATLDSRYYDYASGTSEDYNSLLMPARGPMASRARSARTTAAAYAQFTGRPVAALALFLGGRFDLLHDSFDPVSGPATAEQTATHHAFSPKAGMNLRYAASPDGEGHLYVAVSRSFKAATLDQLYDQRSIPVPFPPFAIQTSNPDLRPQHSIGYEAGFYQRVRLGAAFEGKGSLSLYQTELKDELDFDVATLKYVNLGQSRHRGVEAGMTLDVRAAALFASYALQDATSRSGEHAGKRLKAIPRHSLLAGVTIHPGTMGSAGLTVLHSHGVFLDDANTVKLPDYTRVDAQLIARLRAVSVVAEVRNLFDARYHSSGFLDPAGTGEAYFYPAAPITFLLGLRSGW